MRAVSWQRSERRNITSPSGRPLTRTALIEPECMGDTGWTVARGMGGPGSGPQAQMSQYPTPEVIAPHYHRSDQFQIVVEGGGRIGRRRYDTVSVQYTDAFTPYTIHPDPQGISFYVLRADADSGAYPMPQFKEDKAPGGRAIVSDVRPEASLVGWTSGGTWEPLIDETEDGLRAAILGAAPGESITGLDASHSAGQFYAAVNGSFEFNGEFFDRWSILWIDPGEPPFEVRAGNTGCALVLVQFPVPGDRIEEAFRNLQASEV